MLTLSRPRRLSPLTLATAVLLAACGGAGPDAAVSGHERQISQATLDSLPRATLTDGGRVCYATGYDSCPLQVAVANWLAPDRFALWEPGREIAAYRVGDTVGVPIGGVGSEAGMYANQSAVGADDKGDILVVEATAGTLLRYGGDGKFRATQPLPKLFGVAVWGFAGRVALLERFTAADSTAPVKLEVRVLTSAGDSAGRVALQLPIPWLRLDNSEVTAPLPLIPTQPLYAVADDGSLFWSSAERLSLRRLNRSGGTDWALVSDITGAAITPADLSARRKELEAAGIPAIDLDSMVARTPATYPAVSGILLNRDGRIMLGRTIAAGSDSVDYLMLSKEGVPLSRFSLGARVHPLLLSGDSLLVHRPTLGEPWEVRWLLFAPAR